MLQTMLSIVAPVAVCVAIGFTWKKLNRPYDIDMVSRLVMAVGAPCLVIATLSEVSLAPGTLMEVFGISVCFVVLMLLVAVVYVRLLRVSAGALVASMTFPNVGNIGLPLALLAFGEEGLAYALAVFMVVSIAQMSIGLALFNGGAAFRQLLTHPIIYAVAAAVLMVYTGFRLPPWALNSAALVGDFVIPLMLVTLGVSLAGLGVVHLRLSLALALGRLVPGFLLGVVLAWIFGLEGVARGVVIIQFAMPAAIFNYLFAERFNKSPQVVAGVVVVSTVLSFISLPFLLAYVL